MKIKPLMALIILSTLLLSFSMQSFAEKAAAKLKNQSLVEETPHITNEAEYAEFVKRREGAGAASSVKSTQPIKSSSIRSSLLSTASSSRSKVPVK